MERYLKDEPKLQSYKKLPSELDSWNLIAPPGVVAGSWEVTKVEVVDPMLPLDELRLNDRHFDTISMGSASSGCSRVSWDSSLSCAVVVKQEPADHDEDEEYEDLYEATRLGVNSDPGEGQTMLTPPSSPESGQHSSSSSSSQDLNLITRGTVLHLNDTSQARPFAGLEAADTQVPVPRMQEGLHEKLPFESSSKDAYR
ncbi:UNVERIFIED_CONTAM: hypothetical protein PYX00_001622 [Menopon gallinae]|uniref:Uncharacterized protein n=1 Tax=Menopon gallinae TaxID=328185 RepID=A0AAW2IEV0_9NEOP